MDSRARRVETAEQETGVVKAAVSLLAALELESLVQVVIAPIRPFLLTSMTLLRHETVQPATLLPAKE